MLTAAGPVQLERVYFVCRHCKLGAHPLDGRLGVTGSVSPQAQRLLCLAGASWSFDGGAKNLREFCGLSVSDNWIREVCQQQAAQMEAWQSTAGEARLPFRQAIRDHITQTQRRVRDTTQRESLESLREYLGKHSDHLHYAERLTEGRSIGSGQVEGACKHMIGRRLKQTGARWQLSRVNRMATPCAILYSDHWDAYWAAPELP